MQKWEYYSIIMTEGFGGNASDDEFDEAGREGWELITVSAPTEDTFGVAFFKRPLQEQTNVDAAV